MDAQISVNPDKADVWTSIAWPHLACADCGEPGFVVTPASQAGVAVVLCAVCYAKHWASATEQARG